MHKKEFKLIADWYKSESSSFKSRKAFEASRERLMYALASTNSLFSFSKFEEATKYAK